MQINEDLSKNAVDAALESMRGGGKTEAINIIKNAYDEWKLALHSVYFEMVKLFFSFVEERLGQEGILQLSDHLSQVDWNPLGEIAGDGDRENILKCLSVKFDDLPLNDVLESIESGNNETASAAAKKLWNEWMELHDSEVELMQVFLNFVGAELGEDAIEDVLRYLGEALWLPQIPELSKPENHEALVAVQAAAHRGHGSDFHVEQDEEKSVFVVKCCGSGGVMMKEGKFEDAGRHPLRGCITKNAYPWSFEQKGVSYYCAHCAVWFDSRYMPKEWQAPSIFSQEYNLQFDKDGEPTGKVCKHIFYRKPRT